jgi:hypothetical protein
MALLAVNMAGLMLFDRVQRSTIIVWCAVFGIFGYVLLVSLANDEHGNPWTGLFRYGTGVALACAFSGGWMTGKNYRAVQRLLAAYAMVCALTLAYQWVAGPISWFADSSARAGTARYASLAGSLTAYGGIVAPTLFVALRMRTLWGRWLRGAIIVGALLSLQKASIVGVPLAYATDYLFKRKKLSLRVLIRSFVAALVLSITAYLLINAVKPLGIFVRGAFGELDESKRSDVTIAQSIDDRVVDLPKKSFNYFSSTNLWWGVGVYGAGGATGYDHIPMPHNLFVEIILIHGYVLGAALCLMLVGLAIRSVLIAFDAKASESLQIAAGVYLTVLATSIGAGSVYFHPVSGCFFWSSLLMLLQQREE